MIAIATLFAMSESSLHAPPDRPLAEPLDLLVVAAHPDDAEISVGGTIAKAVAEGLLVGIVDLTTGEPTPRGDQQTRRRETEAANAVLGDPLRWNLGLPNRRLFNEERHRRALAETFRLTRPRLVLGPRPVDVHPDHVAASALVDGARFWSKLSRSDLAGARYWPPRLLHYWSIHLRETEVPSVVVDISNHYKAKRAAVTAYASQMPGHDAPFPSVVDDIEARARYWGWSIGCSYAEPLSDREQIAVRSIGDLLP